MESCTALAFYSVQVRYFRSEILIPAISGKTKAAGILHLYRFYGYTS